MAITVWNLSGIEQTIIDDANRFLEGLSCSEFGELEFLIRDVSCPATILRDLFQELGWNNEVFSIFQSEMPDWKRVLWKGYVPLLNANHLRALADGLERDDSALIQGATCSPPPLPSVENWPVESADAIAYMGWKNGLITVAQIEEFFARLQYDADQLLGERAGVRHWLNWWDSEPRSEVFSLSLREVQMALLEKIATEKVMVPA